MRLVLQSRPLITWSGTTPSPMRQHRSTWVAYQHEIDLGTGRALRGAPAEAGQAVYRPGGVDAGAWYRFEYGAVQRGIWSAAAAAGVPGPGSTGAGFRTCPPIPSTLGFMAELQRLADAEHIIRRAGRGAIVQRDTDGPRRT